MAMHLASAVGGARPALRAIWLQPPGAAPEIDHVDAALEEMMLVVDLDQLVGRARAQAVALGLRDIGIAELPLQPEL